MSFICRWNVSSNGYRICPFISRFCCVFEYTFLSPNLHPYVAYVALNFVRSGTCQPLHEFSFRQLPYLKFARKVLVCREHFRHGYLFRDLPSFGAVNVSEKVDEVVPSTLPFLFGSCLNVQSISCLWSYGCSLLSRSYFWHFNLHLVQTNRYIYIYIYVKVCQ